MNRNSLEQGTSLVDLSMMRSGLHSSRGGAALVIILAFMVMLLGLLMAFFSRTSIQHQVSQASSNLSSVDVLARGAVESVIGDLLGEIAAGSRVTNVGTNTLYYPATNANMVPSISGFTTNAGLENLVKVSGPTPVFSVTNSSGASTNGPIRGTTSASSSPSLNGRSVSAARWNRSLLITRRNTNSTTDYTPVDAFNNAIPDWILIARNGSNPTIWDNNMRWSPTNGTTVIGRYAYAIYNEGGLLDANVAGYPPALTNSSVTNPAYVPYKTGTYFADLTQIGLNGNQITALVGWRNDASAQATGTFPSYTIPGNGAYYGAAMMADTNGLLITYQTNNTSDRRFTSRQQLIEFLKNADTSSSAVAGALNSLQSLGTFSRSLDQPSYAPDTNHPKIVHPVGDNDNVGGTWLSPVVNNLLMNYRGGNDADSDATDPNREDRINPSFLTNRVTASFTRIDGSRAAVGEPLVKKRFPLSRLAWITSTGIPPAGVTSAMIKNAFGLTWCPTMKRWAYDHGFKDSSGSIYIGKLDQVSAANREPDFFELLKASINAGSLGKAASIGLLTRYNSTDNLGAGTYYQMRDKSLENQIYQIGVNLIDQADSDSYPTALWVNNPNRSDPKCTSSTYDGPTFNGTKVFGVEDLPYFNRLFFKAVPDAEDPPRPAAGGAPVDLGSDPSSVVGANFYPGSTILLGQPEVWNPHDSTTWSRSTARPASFRITAVSEDPDGILSIGSIGLAVWRDIYERFRLANVPLYLASSPSGSLTGKRDKSTPTTAGANIVPMIMTWIPPFASNNTLGFTWTTNKYGNIVAQEATSAAGPFSETNNVGLGINEYQAITWPDENAETYLVATNTNVTSDAYGTEMTFSCPNSSLFREPTLLGVNSLPSGSGLAVGPGNRLSLSKTSPKTTSYPNRPPQSGPSSYSGYVLDDSGTQNVGFVLGRCPTRWIQATPMLSGGVITYNYKVVTGNYTGPAGSLFTVRLEYRDPSSGQWLTYDERYIDTGADAYNNAGGGLWQPTRVPDVVNGSTFDYAGSANALPTNMVRAARFNSYDPRSARFGHPMSPCLNYSTTNPVNGTLFPAPDTTTGIEATIRPDNSTLYTAMSAIPGSCNANSSITSYCTNIGWFNTRYPTSYQNGANAFASACIRMGWLVENNPNAPSITFPSGVEAPLYYADADDIVRRASGAFTTATNGSYGPNFEGLATAKSPNLSQSRSVILNRPFRSVAEMSYAFRGAPWKNIDFSAPETGDAALLDVFSVKEAPTNGLVAGKFDLNTRQKPVLKAMLSGAIKSERDGSTISSADLSNVATAVVARTSGTNVWEGPLVNISELAGKLIGKNVANIPSSDLSIYRSTIPAGRRFGSATVDYQGTWSYTGLSAVMANAVSDIPSQKIQSFREASMRAMADAGQTRVWNLLIDVIAQTGKYPQSASNADQFQVAGEKRYWLHIAIDRLTGQVLDKQLEAVNE